ncbi:DUF2306 domain-containing protein [Streptomyces chrestomyceticus]|uniref:DUF2306 domain-containing protein n=1 Tax=Streptomyces chrestomyceticus TaxID=68185 RepID=UPI003796A9FD
MTLVSLAVAGYFAGQCVTGTVQSLSARQVGLAAGFGFGTLALLWAWTSYRGYRAIRERDFASHRAWVIRSFALTFAAPTLRIWLGLLIGVQTLAGSQADGAADAAPSSEPSR